MNVPRSVWSTSFGNVISQKTVESYVHDPPFFSPNSEDYLVEAMEIVEMFCDLLLARFGLLTQMKELDSGIAEQVSSLIWVAPRLQSDVEELRGR